MPYAITRIFASVLLAGALAVPQAVVPANSRWVIRTPELTNGSWYPDGVEQTSCHALQYFLENPANFEYKADLVVPQPDAIKDSVTSKRLGAISGFIIYSVVHTIEYRQNSRQANFPNYIKMILVERTPGVFCEIFNDQDDMAVMSEVGGVYSVSVDSQTVLFTHDRVDGTGGAFKQAYWTFDQDGPIFLDLRVIEDAWQKLLPKGYVMKGGGFDIKTLSFNSPAWSQKDGDGGNISIKFAIRDHRFVIVSQKYEPSTSP